MRETWFLLQSGLGPAAANMAMDEALLESAARWGSPVLRFYGWIEPAATFGYFQKHADIARWTALRPLIRRPTGGGLVPHDADWTYSLVFPPHHRWFALKAVESYRRVHEWLHAAFADSGVTTELSPGSQPEAPGQCFSGAERFDLLWRGRKIAGAAQRRNRLGLLIQGSVHAPSSTLDRNDWETAMTQTGPDQPSFDWAPLELDDTLRQRVEELNQSKYLRPDYNERR
jgi:lipoate-protein ligase A